MIQKTLSLLLVALFVPLVFIGSSISGASATQQRKTASSTKGLAKPTPTPEQKPIPIKELPEDPRKKLKNPVEGIRVPIEERPREPRPTPTPVPPFPQNQDVRLIIKNLLPVGIRNDPASVLVSWSVEERLGVKLDGYEVSLELVGDGVTERLKQTTDARSISLAVSLAGIPADKRAKIFNSRTGGRINAVVKANYTIRNQRKTEQAQSSRTVNPKS